MTVHLSATPTELLADLGGRGGKKTPVGSLASVYFDGRKIWNFRVLDAQWNPTNSRLSIPWPHALISHLDGRASVLLELRTDAATPPMDVAAGELQFGDSASAIQLADALTGAPLQINKWGRLGKSLDQDSAVELRHILQSAADLTVFLKDKLGIDAFITGGTLLGLVREGHLIEGDDDADLAYLSTHENPSDVVMESYAIEAALEEAGYSLVRHSNGHLQVMFAGTDFTDAYYVDIFSYFNTEGWFYGTFHARALSANVTLLPVSPILTAGITLNLPAEPENLLAAIYGPSWRTPDPAFSFETPPAAARRYYWWLNHYDAYREDWEDYHRGLIASPTEYSAHEFLDWVKPKLSAGSLVLELGSGMGKDAMDLVSSGYRVLAVDYSRPAITWARKQASSSTVEQLRFSTANLNSIRQMAAVLKQLFSMAASTEAIAVISSDLLDTLHFQGRDNLLFTLRHVLAKGGRAYLQARLPRHDGPTRDSLEPIGENIFDPAEFESRLAFYGLDLVRLDGSDASAADESGSTEPEPQHASSLWDHVRYVIQRIPLSDSEDSPSTIGPAT